MMNKLFDGWLSTLNPNYVTAIRLPLSLLAFVALLYNSVASLIICLLLTTIIEISDGLDGWLARRYHKTSDWGKLFDPFCDSFFHLLMYLGLLCLFPIKILAIVVGIILFREMFILLLRAWCAHKGLVLAAQMRGKIKMWAQMISVYLLVILALSLVAGVSSVVIGWLEWLAEVALIVALFMTLYSLWGYWRFIRHELK